MHSIESLILPIWSPKNKKFEYGGYPAIWNNSIKSLNWPFILPHIVIGGDILTTFDSLFKISLAYFYWYYFIIIFI